MTQVEKNYSMFAQVYDAIMDEELYDKWLDFSERYFPENTYEVLELACGTGALSERFGVKGYDVVGLDLSEDMLALAKKRAPSVTFVQGDMRALSYEQQFDAVTCYSDSLCYLSNLTELRTTFDGVYQALKEKGVFIFDVHSTYQTDEAYPGFAYHDNAEDFAFVWDTYAGEAPHSVTHELTFFVKDEDGKFMRRDEIHKERTYELAEITSNLTAAGFSRVQVFADFDDKIPRETSLRWFFVAQK